MAAPACQSVHASCGVCHRQLHSAQHILACRQSSLTSFVDTSEVSCLQGVGRRKVGPAQPFQYVQRPHRLGLGAEPAKPEVLLLLLLGSKGLGCREMHAQTAAVAAAAAAAVMQEASAEQRLLLLQ